MRSARDDITSIILNYDAPFEVLEPAVRSVFEAGSGQVLVADNGSETKTADLARVEREFPSARVAKLGNNWGFAGGINRAIALARTPFVAVFNNDVRVAPGAIDAMLDELRAGGPATAGVAPKIVLADDPVILDGVGTLINANGEAWNRGIGQPDVGQYDKPGRVFGLCFAAALLRRELYNANIGALDERYFMYYEDVDWCFRANVRGYRFRTAPEAVVHHAHSYSTRKKGLEFRYHLAERNLVWTVLKNADGLHAYRVAARRLISHASCVVRGGPYPAASRRVLAETARALPVLLRQRRNLARHRAVVDEEFVSLSFDEASFFDAEDFAPLYGGPPLSAAYTRRARMTGNERDKVLATLAARVGTDGDETIAAELDDQPEAVRAYWLRAISERRLPETAPRGQRP